jgi:hypothetical protein
MPGPLVRAAAGTDRYDATDWIVVVPGATGSLTTKASVPGN